MRSGGLAAQARVAHNIEAVFDQMRTHAALLRDVYAPAPRAPAANPRTHALSRPSARVSPWMVQHGARRARGLHCTALHCTALRARRSYAPPCGGMLRRYVAVHRIGAVHANNTVDVLAIFEEQREALRRYY